MPVSRPDRQIGVGRLATSVIEPAALPAAEHDQPARSAAARGKMRRQAESTGALLRLQCETARPEKLLPSCPYFIAQPGCPPGQKLVIMLPKKEFLGREYAGTRRLDVKTQIVARSNRIMADGTHQQRPKEEFAMAFAFTVNGKAQSVDVDANTPLLWVVREHLKLTGTKFGCGAGLCGACTVHIDGKAMRSCQTTMSEVAGKKVTTIEGLSADSLASTAEGLDCRAGAAMRLLPVRPDHAGRRTAGEATRRRRASRSSPTWTATSAAAAPIARSSRRSKPRRGADHDKAS